MELLFFINSLKMGGAERTVSSLSNYWIDKGWGVTIVTICNVDSDFYELDRRIKRLSINYSVNSRNIFEAVINNLSQIYILRSILNKIKPDIAISMMSSANIILSLASRNLSDITLIGSERTYPPKMPLNKIWHYLRKKNYKNFDYLVAQTHKTKQWLKVNTNAKDIVVIPNSIDYPLACCKPIVKPPDKDKSKIIVLAVGRLSKEKGYSTLIECFLSVKNTFSNVSLYILGNGEERGKLEKIRRDLMLENDIFFIGEVGNLNDWYNYADIYTLTSSFEGFPNALLEAQSYGLPAISFDCDTGPSDIIKDMKTGILVPPEDKMQFIRALNFMILNKEFRAHCSNNAVHLRSEYDIEKIAKKWEELFED